MKNVCMGILLFICLSAVNAQDKQTTIGISSGIYKSDYSSPNTSYGFLFEHQLSKKHGIGFELNVREKSQSLSYNLKTFRVNESYFSIPVSYKYYNRILDLSTGPVFNYFIGWEEIHYNPDNYLSGYSIHPMFHFGWHFDLNKTFALTDKIALEPGITYTPMIFVTDHSYWGATLKLKYKL